MTTPKKIELTPEVVRVIATRRAIGVSLRDLEQEFGISRPVINRVLSSDLAKGVIKGVTEDAIASAVISVRKGMSDMAADITRVLTKHLKEDNLEAVKICLKGLGMDAMEKSEAKQAQQFTVILPHSGAVKEVIDGESS